jgi:plasmid segregation protein ParM
VVIVFKIAIDLGYGYVKGINEKGDRYLVRTSVGTGVNRQFSEAFGTAKNSNEHLTIMQNGLEKQYFIGDLARKQSRDCSSPFEKNKIDHPSTKILLAAAAAKLTKGVKDNIHLVTGPPLLYASEQRESFMKSLQGYEAILQFAGEDVSIVKFDRVTVFPQGAAVVYHLLQIMPELLQPGNMFVVVEPGYKTTEILPFEITEEGLIEPVDGYGTTLEVGYHLVEKAVEESFIQKTGSKLPLSVLDRVINTESPIHYKGQQYDLVKEKRNAKEELARNIIDGLNHSLGEHVEFTQKIVFAGGTSQDEIIKNIFMAYSPNSIVLDDGQFANAKGLLEVARLLEEG